LVDRKALNEKNEGVTCIIAYKYMILYYIKIKIKIRII